MNFTEAGSDIVTAILGTTNKTVPFSAFNEGRAGEIFAEELNWFGL